jgi:ParB-like chromosome segregation protein Spo0J
MKFTNEEMHVRWIEDAAATETLERLGVSYADGVVALKMIDWKKSRENLAREEFLDDHHKDRIKRAIENNCSMPKVVLQRTPNGRYIVAGGNHRCTATLELFGMDELVECYVIEVDSEKFKAVCVALNLSNGKPLSHLELLNKAAEYIQIGNTQKAAADLFGLSPTSIAKHCKQLQYSDILGIENTPKNAKMIQRIPEKYLTLRTVRESFGELMRSRSASFDAVERAIELANACDNEQDMVEAIKSVASKPKPIRAGVDPAKPMLMRSVNTAISQLAKITKIGLASLSVDDRKEIAKLCELLKSL